MLFKKREKRFIDLKIGERFKFASATGEGGEYEWFIKTGINEAIMAKPMDDDGWYLKYIVHYNTEVIT